MSFQAVVGASAVGYVKTLQVRLTVGPAAKIRRRLCRSRARSRRRRHHGWRRRSIARIPRTHFTRERAIRLFGFSLAYIFEQPVAIGPPAQGEADGPRFCK